MLNGIWVGIMLLAVVFGAVSGRMEEVNAALLGSGKEAVTLMITLGGSMCLWSGFLRIAERAGFTQALAKITAPLMKFLFPGLPPQGEACRAISMNMAANVLGLGNAATPLGLEAMRRLQEHNLRPGYATHHMIVFVVLNTASIQLFPTTVAALRLEAGSPSPMGILPAVWATSLGAAAAAVCVAKIFGQKVRTHEGGKAR